jgi:hypothetical protein
MINGVDGFWFSVSLLPEIRPCSAQVGSEP